MRGGQRGTLLLAALVSIAITLSVLHNTGVGVPAEGLILQAIDPLRSTLTSVASGASAALTDLQTFGELREENSGLRAELSELRGQVARLSNAAHENGILREALNYLNEHPELQLVTARIVGRDSLDVLDTIVIDRGASSGIRAGMAVVANGGLVGRITRVTHATADVLPVHSPQSTVSVLAQGTEVTADGTLDGTDSGELIMRHIDADDPLEVGNFVMTSGLGGSLPRGIPVGRVLAIEISPASVLRQALVQPLVEPEHLDVLQVIRGQTASP